MKEEMRRGRRERDHGKKRKSEKRERRGKMKKKGVDRKVESTTENRHERKE